MSQQQSLGTKLTAVLKSENLGDGISDSSMDTVAAVLDRAATAGPQMLAAVLIAIIRLWAGSSVVKFLTADLKRACGRAKLSDLFVDALVVSEAFRREQFRIASQSSTRFVHLNEFGVDFKELGVTARTLIALKKAAGAQLPETLDFSEFAETHWLEILMPVLIEAAFYAGGAYVVVNNGFERIVSKSNVQPIRFHRDSRGIVSVGLLAGSVVLGMTREVKTDSGQRTQLIFTTKLFPVLTDELVSVCTGSGDNLIKHWKATTATTTPAKINGHNPVIRDLVLMPALPSVPEALLSVPQVATTFQLAQGHHAALEEAIGLAEKRQQALDELDALSVQVSDAQEKLLQLRQQLEVEEERLKALQGRRDVLVKQVGDPEKALTLAELSASQQKVTSAVARLTQLVEAFAQLSS